VEVGGKRTEYLDRPDESARRINLKKRGASLPKEIYRGKWAKVWSELESRNCIGKGGGRKSACGMSHFQDTEKYCPSVVRGNLSEES